MRNIRNVVWVALFGGCGGDEFTQSEYIDQLLAKATVSVDDDDTTVVNVVRRDWAGSLNVDGDSGNFELNIISGYATVRIDVYTPSGIDLNDISGQEVDVTVAPEPITDELSVAVYKQGTTDLLYLLEPVTPGLLTDERFGFGMIAPADDLGSVRTEDGWDVSISSYYLRADGGDVVLFPGEPQEVMLEGVTYRATILAGFTADRLAQGAAEECVGPNDRIAFELLQVEPGSVDPTPILRPESVPAPLAQCFPIY